MMGWLYMFPRRLYWRRWQPKLSKLSQHFFLDLVRELSDSISYFLPSGVPRMKICFVLQQSVLSSSLNKHLASLFTGICWSLVLSSICWNTN
jgi:hypothetical protein